MDAFPWGWRFVNWLITSVCLWTVLVAIAVANLVMDYQAPLWQWCFSLVGPCELDLTLAAVLDSTKSCQKLWMSPFEQTFCWLSLPWDHGPIAWYDSWQIWQSLVFLAGRVPGIAHFGCLGCQWFTCDTFEVPSLSEEELPIFCKALLSAYFRTDAEMAMVIDRAKSLR